MAIESSSPSFRKRRTGSLRGASLALRALPGVRREGCAAAEAQPVREPAAGRWPNGPEAFRGGLRRPGAPAEGPVVVHLPSLYGYSRARPGRERRPRVVPRAAGGGAGSDRPGAPPSSPPCASPRPPPGGWRRARSRRIPRSRSRTRCSALIADGEGRRDDARDAFGRAVEHGSQGFYAHYRLAQLLWKPDNDPAHPPRGSAAALDEGGPAQPRSRVVAQLPGRRAGRTSAMRRRRWSRRGRRSGWRRESPPTTALSRACSATWASSTRRDGRPASRWPSRRARTRSGRAGM